MVLAPKLGDLRSITRTHTVEEVALTPKHVLCYMH